MLHSTLLLPGGRALPASPTWDCCRDLRAWNGICCLCWERGTSPRLPGLRQMRLQPRKNLASSLVSPDQMSGLLALTPRAPEKAAQTPAITAAGSSGLCCDKRHLYLKTPPRIIFCCSWGRCSEETVLATKQAGFVLLGSCSQRSSHGSAPPHNRSLLSTVPFSPVPTPHADVEGEYNLFERR